MLRKYVMILSLLIMYSYAAEEKNDAHSNQQLQNELQKMRAEIQQIKKCSSWTSEYVRCTIKNCPLICVRAFAEMIQACEDDTITDAWWR